LRAGTAQGALRAGIDAIVFIGHVNIAERPAENRATGRR